MSHLVGGIGAGMVAVGSVDLLKSFGALNGDFDIPVINGDVLAGDVLAGDVLSGDDSDIPVINGDDDFLNGDDED
jgi:ligand-binding sensor protein